MDVVDLQMRLKWYGLFWRPKTPGRFMMRLRVPNGIRVSNAKTTGVIPVIGSEATLWAPLGLGN